MPERLRLTLCAKPPFPGAAALTPLGGARREPDERRTPREAHAKTGSGPGGGAHGPAARLKAEAGRLDAWPGGEADDQAARLATEAGGLMATVRGGLPRGHGRLDPSPRPASAGPAGRVEQAEQMRLAMATPALNGRGRPCPRPPSAGLMDSPLSLALTPLWYRPSPPLPSPSPIPLLMLSGAPSPGLPQGAPSPGLPPRPVSPMLSGAPSPGLPSSGLPSPSLPPQALTHAPPQALSLTPSHALLYVPVYCAPVDTFALPHATILTD